MSTAVGGKRVGGRVRGVLGVMAAALVLMTAGVAVAEDTYFIISGSSGFTAIKDDDGVGPPNSAIQTVVDAIKADAQGKPCTIQFGSGGAELNIGSSNITFDGGSDETDWGLVTLTGKLRSSRAVLTGATIYLTNGASIESKAELINAVGSANTEGIGTVSTIYNASTGTVTVSGGSVSSNNSLVSMSYSANNSYCIYNASTGTVAISGGTVLSSGGASYGYTSSYGIYNASGTVAISGGTVTSSPGYAIGGAYSYGVYNESGTVAISGGTAASTYTSGYGIYNVSTGTTAVSGGTATVNGGTIYIVNGNSTGVVAVKSATVSSSTGSGGDESIIKITADPGDVSVVNTADSVFDPNGQIYALYLSEYSVDGVAVADGAEFLSNFMLYDSNGKPLLDYRLAASGSDLVIRYALTSTPYTVRFDLNGGSGVKPDTIRVLSGSKLPPVSAEGFNGPYGVGPGGISGYLKNDGKWYTDSSGTTEFVFGANGTAVTGDLTLYLKWVQNNSILSFDRVIPNGNNSEVAVVAPVAALSGELAVGPNPVGKSSGSVVFFWNGKPIKSGALTIYDASGNVVRKLAIKDNAVTGSVSKRAVGSWDLRDGKGRQVSEGTYLVKGKVVTFGGKAERVSVVVGVR